MIFLTGLHHPGDAVHVAAAFISVHRLRGCKRPVRPRRWIMDSGAFTMLDLHGCYPDSPEAYAAEIRRWATNGSTRSLRAVSQDYMCEPFMLAKTGLTLAAHQRLTIERYDALIACDTGRVGIMPVLQGYSPQSYVEHVRAYGDRLRPRMWVGVGSVCKRNADPAAIRGAGSDQAGAAGPAVARLRRQDHEPGVRSHSRDAVFRGQHGMEL